MHGGCMCVCGCATKTAFTLVMMPVLSYTRVWLLTTTIPEDDTFSSGGSGVVISFLAMTMSFEQSSAGVGIMLKIEAVVFPETCRSDTHAIGVQVTHGVKAGNSNGSRHRVRSGQRRVRRDSAVRTIDCDSQSREERIGGSERQTCNLVCSSFFGFSFSFAQFSASSRTVRSSGPGKTPDEISRSSTHI